MTLPIAMALAVLPGGAYPAAALSADEVQVYLRTHYGSEAECARRERHARRNNLYRDGGCEYMCEVIDAVFQDPEVKELRKKWVKHARFSNSLKRITDEVSTVYAEPAIRSVGGDPTNEARFDAVTEGADLDGVMAYANRMLNLHRAILLGPRVRIEEDESRSLTLDVVTPDNVFAVVDPNDSTRVIAWGVKVEYRSARDAFDGNAPAWCLWNAHESWLLNKDFRPIGEPTPHTLGVNPWLAVTYHAEAIPGFWPGEEGEDLVAAQVAIWMANVLLLKETKSATTQTILSGDTSNAARGQASDTETPINVPDGVVATTVDMSMDTGTFTRAADHALSHVGANYGLAMAVITQQGAQSAEARELLLEPLRQIRRNQIKTFRRVERRLVELIRTVLAADAPALAFTVERWSCDFGEPQVLMSAKDRLDLFDRMKAYGFASVVDFYCAYVNPDATPEEAMKAIAKNYGIEDARITLMRHLMAISGELGGRAAQAGGAPTGGRPPMRANDGGAATAPAEVAQAA